MADDTSNIITIAGNLEQLANSDDVGRMVDRAASHDGDKWVTATWMAMRLKKMGLQGVNRQDVSVVLDDLDVRRRRHESVASLSHLRAMAQGGVIAAYIEDLVEVDDQKAAARHAIPTVVANLGAVATPGEAEAPQGALFALEGLAGAKNGQNATFEH